jgi:hypothetical protein
MKLTQDPIATTFLVLSICGVSLIVIMTISTASKPDFIWRKPILGGLFCIECTLGIFAGTFPSKCSELLHFSKTQPVSPTVDSGKTLLGHHPSCGRFSAHTIKFRGKVLCAGCTGLIFGAILSLLGTLLYFFLDINIALDPMFLLLFGVTGVCFGLLQYHLFNWGGNIVHLIINVYFVYGVFLFLIAIDSMTKNWMIELYLVVFSIFWIITRIKLSQVEHKLICALCSIDECIYRR